MDKGFAWLLVFIPLAAGAAAFGGSPVAVFFLSALAIVPLAKYIGDATEALAGRMGTAWGGLLNVTLGNATELIIGVIAIRAGLIDVVKAAITGSILGNILLVLGTAMAVGGARFTKQTFNRTAALASGSTLFLAVVALTLPSILPLAAPGLTAADSQQFSIFVSFAMLVMYASMLFFSLHTHKYLYSTGIEGKEAAKEIIGTKKLQRARTTRDILILCAATLGVAWMSDLLVGTITPLTASLGWTDLFVGVVIIAIVGNAAEHASAITVAAHNKMDLAIQIAAGSATQVAMFVAPVLVFVSQVFPSHMDLVFDPFELVSVIMAVIILNLVIEDGESNWLEGIQLVIAYAIIAIAFFIHP